MTKHLLVLIIYTITGHGEYGYTNVRYALRAKSPDNELRTRVEEIVPATMSGSKIEFTDLPKEKGEIEELIEKIHHELDGVATIFETEESIHF